VVFASLLSIDCSFSVVATSIAPAAARASRLACGGD
jgi:hypothetical protein